jgi:hypothetical protein
MKYIHQSLKTNHLLHSASVALLERYESAFEPGWDQILQMTSVPTIPLPHPDLRVPSFKPPTGSCDTYNADLKEILATDDIEARPLDLEIEARSETPLELKEHLRSDIGKAGIPKQPRGALVMVQTANAEGAR